MKKLLFYLGLLLMFVSCMDDPGDRIYRYVQSRPELDRDSCMIDLSEIFGVDYDTLFVISGPGPIDDEMTSEYLGVPYKRPWWDILGLQFDEYKFVFLKDRNIVYEGNMYQKNIWFSYNFGYHFKKPIPRQLFQLKRIDLEEYELEILE